MEKTISKGPYDIVIIDPPSRKKRSFMADKGYVPMIRRLPALLPEGGEVLACLNPPELGEGFLHDLFNSNFLQANYIHRLNNREGFPESDPKQI